MNETNDLKLRRAALITGVTDARGIGFSIATRLATDGWDLILTGPPGLSEDVQICAAKVAGMSGQEVFGVEADACDGNAMAAALALGVDRFGSISALINNAGTGRGSPRFLENDAEDWEVALGVNLIGVVVACREALPILSRGSGGSIVNIASIAGLGVNPGMPYPYTVSKTALIALTKQLAIEFAAAGVRVNAVCPGAVRTGMLELAYRSVALERGISVEDAAAAENESIAAGRPGEPDEIASVVRFLLGPDASYVTGIALPVAGGMAAGL
jgi:meso-butanediol dehydrogenase/(S,S)-butanediol dehydrogenase/diacetyl reductase